LLFDQLGTGHFCDDAKLVLPTTTFFPANASNAQQLAQSTLEQIKAHAGMTQWPIDITENGTASSLPKLAFEHSYHGSGALVTSDYSEHNRIVIGLDITQFPKAETLVATLSQQLSSMLLTYSQAPSTPQDYIAKTELLATMLGFGVMLANTSYQFRGGCGSCYQSRANRQTGLSEEEMVYSLALFCRLKGIKNNGVLPHLKKYLRAVYKKSLRDIDKQQSQLQLLQARLSSQAQIGSGVAE